MSILKFLLAIAVGIQMSKGGIALLETLTKHTQLTIHDGWIQLAAVIFTGLTIWAAYKVAHHDPVAPASSAKQ